MQRNVVLEHVRKLDSGAGLFSGLPFFSVQVRLHKITGDRNKT